MWINMHEYMWIINKSACIYIKKYSYSIYMILHESIIHLCESTLSLHESIWIKMKSAWIYESQCQIMISYRTTNPIQQGSNAERSIFSLMSWIMKSVCKAISRWPIFPTFLPYSFHWILNHIIRQSISFIFSSFMTEELYSG